MSQRAGYGRQVYSNGDVYEGRWQQGKKNGQGRLERDAEDIFSWLSQQHGMWMTHIELEYIIEETNVATNNLYVERDHYKGKCYLKAVNYCEYVKCTT